MNHWCCTDVTRPMSALWTAYSDNKMRAPLVDLDSIPLSMGQERTKTFMVSRVSVAAVGGSRVYLAFPTITRRKRGVPFVSKAAGRNFKGTRCKNR